ncbi:superoxide dismutase [Fe], chloroplastic-like isoform X2 [Phalaenopsis equestris]|uniref:superoxide dismutase [Fe], chloroplastic-like isoform X2 n=1 Tax=Phalaenopsis equestris TaxID=78828 RepID=UPI0009E3100B|nr:superoxide dismutase [Fe], chloroplastic-like isoform X2 [Phalaenopsis equestris]
MRMACLASELSSSTALVHPLPHRWRSTFPRIGGTGRWPSPKILRCASINVRSYFQLIPPPYPLSSLEPYMSRETMENHWGRHHRDHLNSLNTHIAGSELNEMPLEEIILTSYNKGDFLPVFIHAAQTWNHDFFWQSMKPGGGGRPSGILLKLMERDFGSFELFLKEFKTAALTQFGSGWVWLTYKSNRLDVGNAINPCPSAEDNKLVVTKTPNAINPLVWDYSPLLAIDVWEHAYYLDYENQRSEYISLFMDKLVSWDFVSSRLEMALAREEERAREDASNAEEDDLVLADSDAREMFLDSDEDDAGTQ